MHEIPVMIRQKQIVCSDLSCREVDASLIRHIFVPFDGSPFSKRAFEFALDLASKYNSSITVGTVMSDGISENFLVEEYGSDRRVVDREKLATLEKHFEKIHMLSTRFSIPVKTEVFVSTSVSETLVNYANSSKADLIIMGTRGKGDNRLMLGSVSIAVSQKAASPVLLIK